MSEQTFKKRKINKEMETTITTTTTTTSVSNETPNRFIINEPLKIQEKRSNNDIIPNISKCDPKEIKEIWVHKNCPDGMGAALTAFCYAKNQGIVYNFVFLTHGEPLPNAKNKRIAIFDFCPKQPDLQKLIEEAKSVIVYDHHESERDTVNMFPDNCYYSETHSGVFLAWKFFFLT